MVVLVVVLVVVSECVFVLDYITCRLRLNLIFNIRKQGIYQSVYVHWSFCSFPSIGHLADILHHWNARNFVSLHVVLSLIFIGRQAYRMYLDIRRFLICLHLARLLLSNRIFRLISYCFMIMRAWFRNECMAYCYFMAVYYSLINIASTLKINTRIR